MANAAGLVVFIFTVFLLLKLEEFLLGLKFNWQENLVVIANRILWSVVFYLALTFTNIIKG